MTELHEIHWTSEIHICFHFCGLCEVLQAAVYATGICKAEKFHTSLLSREKAAT